MIYNIWHYRCTNIVNSIPSDNEYNRFTCVVSRFDYVLCKIDMINYV